MIFGIGKIRIINSRLGVDILVENLNISKKKNDERTYLSDSIITNDKKIFYYGDYIRQDIKIKHTDKALYQELAKLKGTQDTIIIPHVDFSFSYTAIITLVKEDFVRSRRYDMPIILIKAESRFPFNKFYIGLQFVYKENPTGISNILLYTEDNTPLNTGFIADGFNNMFKSDFANNRYMISYNGGYFLDAQDNGEIIDYDESVVSVAGLNVVGLQILPSEIVLLGSTATAHYMLRMPKGTFIAVPTELTAIGSFVNRIEKGYVNGDGVAWIYVDGNIATFELDDPVTTYQSIVVGAGFDFCMISNDRALIFDEGGNYKNPTNIKFAYLSPGGFLASGSLLEAAFKVQDCCRYMDDVCLYVYYHDGIETYFIVAIQNGLEIATRSVGSLNAPSLWVDASDNIYISDVTNNRIRRTKLNSTMTAFESYIDTDGISTAVPNQDPFGFEALKL